MLIQNVQSLASDQDSNDCICFANLRTVDCSISKTKFGEAFIGKNISLKYTV